VRESHEELPYFIHAKTNVPYLVGRQGHTVIAVELKKFRWSIKLQKTKENTKDIVAKKKDEKWRIRIKTIDARLSDVLRNLPVSTEEIDELVAVSEREKALPVIAVVASDSAVLLSATTFKALSP
jgi:Holliday junction resolvase